MRGLLGIVLLLAGVGALGWWGATYSAERIEQRIAERAEAIVARSIHGATVEVSGRDVTLRGLVDSEAERDALLTELDLLNGRRIVRDESDILASASPFSLSLQMEEGVVVAEGFVPSEAARSALEPVIGRAAGELELASGGPVEWVAAVSAGFDAIAALQGGRLTLEDTSMRVSGIGTRAEIALAEAALEAVPGTYQVARDIAILDDGVPLSLRAEAGPDGIALAGKLPFGAVASDLEVAAFGQAIRVAEIDALDQRFLTVAAAGLSAVRALEIAELSVDDGQPAALSLTGQGTRAQIAAALDALEELPPGLEVETRLTPLDDGLPLGVTADKVGDVVTLVGKVPFGMAPASLGLDAFEEAVFASEIDAKAPDFVAVAEAGLSALAAFDSGTLILQDAETAGGPARLRLEGQVTRSGLDAVNAALALLPGGIVPEIDVVFADDGTPMRLSAVLSEGVINISGKVPFGSQPAVLSLESFGDAVLIAEIQGQDEAFLLLAARGLEALKSLESGQFDIVDSAEGARLELSGIALTPIERDRAITTFGEIAVNVDIATLDDGTPPAFDLVFDMREGVSLSGKLPRGVSADQIAEALGVSAIESTAVEGLVGEAGIFANTFQILAAWLPETERVQARFGATGFEGIVVIPAPGVDKNLLFSDLSAVSGAEVTLAVGELPSVGATRQNFLTGKQERFSGFAWLPVFEFAPSVARCDEESKRILTETRINFVTGSARLDTRSVRAVNALAGAIAHCLGGAPGLRVEIAGHTDAEGAEASNITLSQARAEAVREALFQRGVTSQAITAAGYGEAKPIADNGTIEGRAANRRTEIRWSAP
ncbi:MAG: OmpA family protein [Pseudomonadota bacterium]